MNLKRISKKALISWYIGRVFNLFFFAVLQTGFLVFFSKMPYFGEIRRFLYAFLFLSAIYLTLSTAILPPLKYLKTKYSVDGERFILSQGIFFKKHTIVPFARIQHISLFYGPVNERLKIAGVTLNTASGVFTLDGIAKSEAEKIEQKVKNQNEGRVRF